MRVTYSNSVSFILHILFLTIRKFMNTRSKGSEIRAFHSICCRYTLFGFILKISICKEDINGTNNYRVHTVQKLWTYNKLTRALFSILEYQYLLKMP